MLARVGLGSRRACEELIADGRVTVNGELAELGRRVDIDHDRVELDGVPLPVLPGLVHYLLNKPAGVVTTADDPDGRPTVVELVPDDPRVFPVGRLDADSEGLLVLTNDGELAQRLTHPSFGVEKEYLVEVDGVPVGRGPAPAAPRGRARRRQDGPGHGGRGRPRRAAHRHPRRPQPPGPAHVRGRRPSGAPPGAHPDRALSDPRLKPGTWRALDAAEVRALGAPRRATRRAPAPADARPGQRLTAGRPHRPG